MDSPSLKNLQIKNYVTLDYITSKNVSDIGMCLPTILSIFVKEGPKQITQPKMQLK